MARRRASTACMRRVLLLNPKIAGRRSSRASLGRVYARAGRPTGSAALSTQPRRHRDGRSCAWLGGSRCANSCCARVQVSGRQHRRDESDQRVQGEQRRWSHPAESAEQQVVMKGGSPRPWRRSGTPARRRRAGVRGEQFREPRALAPARAFWKTAYERTMTTTTRGRPPCRRRGT